MCFSFSNRVTVADDVLVRELDSELVLLNLNNECYYGLDAVGTRIWKRLETSESIEVAYHALLREFDVDPDKLRADMQKLLSELIEHQLIHVADPSLRTTED